jgi:hypothetical protein
MPIRVLPVSQITEPDVEGSDEFGTLVDSGLPRDTTIMTGQA